MPQFTTRSFADIVRDVEQCERYLREHGLKLHPDSVLSRDIARTKELLALFQDGHVPENYAHHEAVTSMANATCLSKVIVESVGTPFEKWIRKRLRALRSGEPGPLAPGRQSQERDAIFELICGFACTRFSEDVELEEPDVTCRFLDHPWGLACKCAYGKPRTVAQRIREGINQIATSGVSKGFVVVQVTNRFPHEDMYHYDESSQTITSFHDLDAQHEVFKRLVQRTVAPIQLARYELSRQFPAKLPSSFLGVAYLAHTVAYFRQLRCVMGGIQVEKARSLNTHTEFAFAVEFNSSVQQLV